MSYVNDFGYLMVEVCDVRTREEMRRPAHRLVAAWMWRLPSPEKLTVHHRDGDKLNNHWSNLIFYLTHSEHMALHHAHRVDEWRQRAKKAEKRARWAEASARRLSGGRFMTYDRWSKTQGWKKSKPV